MTVEEFETQVMTALLAGDDPLLAALREQYAVAKIERREVTGGGFTTTFDVPAGVPIVDRKLLFLDDLQVELEGGEGPVDTSLTVSHGRLRSLECTVYQGSFPESPAITAAWYYGTKKHPGITNELMRERDLEGLLDGE